MVNFRLIKLVESRIHREVYVRFGGEYPKIRHRNMKMDVGCLAYIQNTVGNVFAGQVLGETAKNLSERFGKVLQQRKSVNMTREDTSTSISTQLDSLIPASKISNLSQGMFVGSVCDSFQEKMEQKIFHCEIVVDNARVAAETKAYKPIPVITDFTGRDGKDHMREEIERNYYRIKEEVGGIIQKELRRIGNDPDLKHLLETEDDG